MPDHCGAWKDSSSCQERQHDSAGVEDLHAGVTAVKTGGSISVSRERAVVVGRHKQDFMQTRHEAQGNVGM